jgi:hypothetical protein
MAIRYGILQIGDREINARAATHIHGLADGVRCAEHGVINRELDRAIRLPRLRLLAAWSALRS